MAAGTTCSNCEMIKFELDICINSF